MNGNLSGLPLEPPKPAICIGNGFVMEVTNDVSPPPPLLRFSALIPTVSAMNLPLSR